MKKYLAVMFILTLFNISGFKSETAFAMPGDFRAVWVCSAYNLDFPSKKGLTNDQLKQEIDTIIDRAAHIGMNALVVQVRPASDALYKSAYFPWSETITGTQGQAPADGFDPLLYWVERAHAKGLEVHAWINPYRITYANQKITDVSRLSINHPARNNPTWAIAYKDALFFDPGRPEVRKLLADSVAEIVKNYKVDGIHLDDYFYPGTDFPDAAAYRQYGNGLTLDDWRRENVNSLIKLLQKTVRDINPQVRYGISPTAIWQNRGSTPLGSDTRGFESYKSAYADTRRWVKEGWLDYICPQIYWHIGFDIADYEKVLNWWIDVCRDTNVDLYIGQAAYRELDGSRGWTAGETIRQLEMNAKSPVVKGSIFFREASLRGDVGDRIRAYYLTRNLASATVPVFAQAAPPVLSAAAPALRMDRLSVAQPSRNVTVNGDHKGYNVLGTAVPGVPLYMNSQLITNRTDEGFFSVYAPLVKGDNTFTFTQQGQTAVTRVITLRDAAVTPPPVMSPIAVNDAYPSADEMGGPNERITLRCTAPAGATVTALLNGVTVSLAQDNANIRNSGATVYAAAYSGTFTLPNTAAGSVTDLGKPVYTVTFNSQRYTATAAGSVRVIGAEAPLYGEVTANLTWAFPNAATTGGSAWSLEKGQRDRITGVTGNGRWTRLSSGVWVESNDLARSVAHALQVNVLTNGRYIPGQHEDAIVWNAAANAAVSADFDGSRLIIRFGMQRIPPPHSINPVGTMFESISLGTDNGAPCYILTLRPDARLEGFYMEYQNGELRLHLKKRKALAAGERPLTGFSFIIDAGHGDTDSGALGPMGAAMPEKALNLVNAQKLAARLTQLGANVTMTRDTDVFHTLQARVEMSRRVNPDMFISMHANSLAETTDATNVRGFTTWYRNANSKPLADVFMKNLHNINPLTTRHPNPNQSNLFVTRPVWTPSIIVEASFMNNVDDFSWLVNGARQDDMAQGIVNTILAYYR
jgi:uncharacterized lipoprotein YddW (UPF0748 family)/N-acetylmuramoyl-L-alanine amidase